MHAIDIKFKPSKIFFYLIFLSLLSNVLIIFYLPVTGVIKTSLFVFIILYSHSLLWADCLLKNNHAIKVLKFQNDSWQLNDGDKLIPVKLCGSSTLTSYISILRFKIEGKKKKRSIVIFRDSLPPRFYRRMIVLLRTIKI